MDTESESKIYGIASRLNGEEFLIMNMINEEPGIIAYRTFDEAKGIFDNLYKIYLQLLGTDAKRCGELMLWVINFYSVILGIPQQDAEKTIQKYRKGTMIFTSQVQFLSDPHLYAPMRSGFIDEFTALDIVKDLESITTVGPDGKMLVQKFEIHRGPDAKMNEVKPLLKEDMDKILKERGLR